MSDTRTPQNAHPTPPYGFRLVRTAPTLEEQAQNLVSAMEHWNDLVDIIWRRDDAYHAQIEELSRLYRCAHRQWLLLCRQLGGIPSSFVPGWVDDFYTYP